MFSIRLEDVAPRRADRKRGIDQSDVGIGLGKIAALLIRARDEVFGQQADVVASRHHAIEDGACVIDAPQTSQGLGDPQRTYDKGAVGLSKVVFADIAVKKSRVLLIAFQRQVLNDM